MAFEHKPGSFTLFRNDKKGVETRPDYAGEGMALDGTPIRVSAWLKEGSKGGKFMSCNMQPKDGDYKPKQEAKPEPKPTAKREFDESTAPF